MPTIDPAAKFDKFNQFIKTTHNITFIMVNNINLKVLFNFKFNSLLNLFLLLTIFIIICVIMLNINNGAVNKNVPIESSLIISAINQL